MSTKHIKNHRAKQKIQARLDIVSKYYRRGYGYRKIREEVMRELELKTYSLGTVKGDVHRLLELWRSEQLKNMDEKITLELKRIDMAQIELWEQWESSKYKSRDLLADPRYMAEIRSHDVERRKLLGLYAPNKTELTGKDGEPLVPTTYIFGNAEFIDTFTQIDNDSTNEEDTRNTEENIE